MTGYRIIAIDGEPGPGRAVERLVRAIGAPGRIDAVDAATVIELDDPGADRAGAVALRQRLRGVVPELDVAVRVRPCAPAALVVFDMDSTLLAIEVIDELARRRGVGAEVAAITERAMRGELDFEASLRARVAKLAGLPIAALDELAAALPLSPGAAAAIAGLNARGARCAIASGGFTFAAEVLARQLGLVHAAANTLGIADGVLTGEVIGPVITAEAKARVVRTLAERWAIPPAATVAVGDGANDRAMLAQAGFGVAFRAKPALAAMADATIEHGGLDRLLTFVA